MPTNQEIINRLNADIKKSLNQSPEVVEENVPLVEQSDEIIMETEKEQKMQPDTRPSSNKDQTQEEKLPYSNERTEKVEVMQNMLPGFNAYANYIEGQIAKQQDKLNTINVKIGRAQDKLEKLQNKLDSSRYRSEFFKYIRNANTLPAVNGILNALIKNEERKISPLSEKIAAKKAQITDLQKKADNRQKKIDKKIFKLNSVKAISDFIKNFANRNTEERRAAYMECLKALNKASLDKNQSKLSSLNNKIATYNEQLSDDTLTNVEKLKIKRKLDKCTVKAQTISFRIENFADEKLDKAIKNTIRSAEFTDKAIEEAIDKTFETVADIEADKVDSIADTLNELNIENLQKYADKSIEKLNSISVSHDNEKAVKSAKKDSVHEKIQKLQQQIKQAEKSVDKDLNKIISDKSL